MLLKKFISDELDAVLQSDEVIQATNGTKKESKKTSNRESQEQQAKAIRSRGRIQTPQIQMMFLATMKKRRRSKKPKKRPAQKLKVDTKGSKRQKISAQKSKASSAGKKKPVDNDLEKSDESDGGKSEDDRSQSLGEEEEVKVVSILSLKERCERASIDEVYLDLTQAAESMLLETPPEVLEEIDEEMLKSHVLGVTV
ncbi:uncharacterized protein A4U43_C07F2230 [Asparagus officinalis]|uniref:Uncharacterized protein n=1 Tax=Asparagus officinalis TaxID=4686 RepID=A0A5P1E8Q1_ASPOF|nr:uncharacterized protein LOC109850567 isoform X1 [Asparagus officinalis]ONK62275.1 uncharacterized protein A4U43_C07F2230 [Asparagus officinalis]